MSAAEKLIDLKKKDSTKYKANKNAQGKGTQWEKPVKGLARAVELHMGDWQGKVDLTLSTMDDLKVEPDLKRAMDFDLENELNLDLLFLIEWFQTHASSQRREFNLASSRRNFFLDYGWPDAAGHGPLYEDFSYPSPAIDFDMELPVY
ncbi:hypothetical protein MLD38_040532 [Melastoma candidum]|nr:hypothetical protein MLD38_040532 [Melastoma candidum]